MSRFILFCEPCGYKKIHEDGDCKLVRIPRSRIQLNIPALDEKTGKTQEFVDEATGEKLQSKFREQPAQFRCPNCGRGVTVKAIPDAFNKIIKQREQEAEERQHTAEMEKEGWVPKPIEQEAKEAIEHAKKSKSKKKNNRS